MSAFADNITSAFAEQRSSLLADESQTLAKIRDNALNTVKTLGLPGPRDEQWKYTSVAKIANNSFEPASADAFSGVKAEDIPTPAFSEHRIVFIDGLYSAALSSLGTLPGNVTATPLAQLLSSENVQATNALEQDHEQLNVFGHLNTSFVQDGLLLQVGPGETPPIEVVFVDSGQSKLSCPRLIVDAATNSELTLIETHCSISASEGLTSAVTTLNADTGARIRHYRLQLDDSAHHIGNVTLNAKADSTISTYSIALGGNLTRVDINGQLLASGSHIDMYGLFLAKGSQHIDHHTRINHLAANTTSKENFKGIADDQGHGVFNGKVYVEQDAQKIVAEQSSKNLLLSNQAEIDTKPELEIYADDVQCAHGATVGQLREDELFYLLSRGIDATTARTMLTIAFAGDVVEEIEHEPLRRAVEEAVTARLGGPGE